MNTLYSKIVLATDLGPQSLYIAKRALALAALNQAECFVLHVIEPPITYVSEFNQREKLLKKNKSAAEKSLASFCATLNQSALPQFVNVGAPQTEIITFAYENQCDLIVLGSHGVGGYTHMLGSTAHTLISEAYCDTLVIQVSHLETLFEKITPQEGKYLWDVPAIGKHSAFKPNPVSRTGSEQGFGEVVKRGPRPSLRPASFPYKGGTRERDDNDDNSKKSE